MEETRSKPQDKESWPRGCGAGRCCLVWWEGSGVERQVRVAAVWGDFRMEYVLPEEPGAEVN